MVSSACAKPPSAEDAARRVLEALAYPESQVSRHSPRLYAQADLETRQALEARAAQIGEALGVEIRPHELLQWRGLHGGRRLGELVPKGSPGERQAFEMTLVGLDYVAGAEPVAPRTLPLGMRRDGERWQLDLVGLPELIKTSPIMWKDEGEGRHE